MTKNGRRFKRLLIAGAAGFAPGLDDEEDRCRPLVIWGSAGVKDDGRHHLTWLGRVDLANRPVTK